MTTKTVKYSTDEIYPDYILCDNDYSDGYLDLDLDFIEQYNHHCGEYLRMRAIIEKLIEEQG